MYYLKIEIPFRLALTVGLVDRQTVDDVVVGRFVTVGLAQGPVVRGRPASGRCGLHHAERGVRTHVVVDALSAAAHEHLVPGIVPFTPLQRRRRVLDLLVGLVTALPLGRTARPPPPRVLRPVFFPVQTQRGQHSGLNNIHLYPLHRSRVCRGRGIVIALPIYIYSVQGSAEINQGHNQGQTKPGLG